MCYIIRVWEGSSVTDIFPKRCSLFSELFGNAFYGIKFVEFRNGGRLGCPHDYEAFREDLVPLLESVHGEPKHAGKIPRHRPSPKRAHNDLASLRKKLQTAVDAEKYEEAADLRDRIKRLETN